MEGITSCKHPIYSHTSLQDFAHTLLDSPSCLSYGDIYLVECSCGLLTCSLQLLSYSKASGARSAQLTSGYNQGVMGSVNGVPDYIDTVNIGRNGIVTDTTKQGGIVAIYYFGAMFGCFIGGRLGDKYGRKRAVILGSTIALIGGALQAGSISAAMSLVARVIVGLGIGFINAVSPSQ